MSVEKNLQVHISTTTDPKVAWDTLKNQFECVSNAQVVRLNRKFYAATMSEGTDILEHLTHMTSLAEQLREMNEEISEQTFATVVLGSLPKFYDNFISSHIKALLIEEHLKNELREVQNPRFLVKMKHCLARKEICLAKKEIRRKILERNLKIDL